MHYCLNREELSQLIEFKARGKDVEVTDLAVWIEASRNWQVELGCLSYLFAQILEKKQHSNQDRSGMICLLYDLVDEMYLRIHECDYDFITYMLRFLHDSNLSLEEQLVELHNDMCEYRYK